MQIRITSKAENIESHVGALQYRSPHICRCHNALRYPPPPTAQTEHDRDLKFDMEILWVNRFGATEAIFNMLPLTQNLGVGWGSPRG